MWFFSTKFKDWNAETIPCFSWIYKQPDERSRHGGFVQQQLLTIRDECEWEGHVAPLIDRCSLIGKGVGFFTAFFRDSALRECRLSAQFWVWRVLVANCTLAAEIGWERDWERERERERERARERIDGDGEREVLHFTTTATEWKDFITIIWQWEKCKRF